MLLQAAISSPTYSLQRAGATAHPLLLSNNSATTGTTTANFLSSSSLSADSAGGRPTSVVLQTNRQKGGFRTFASDEKTSTLSLTGVVFQPFEEIKNDEFLVPLSPSVSLARQRFSHECEAAINEQINAEYCVSYAYHAMYAYFDRDNIALKGLAKFFKESSEEEREHAEKLMKYQNIRGGRVTLLPLKEPKSEFDHVEKGDALYAMEVALCLEKLINAKLLEVHSVADRNNDPQMQDFIESEFLGEQVEAIKKISDYITQLRMVGKGHGVWHFNQKLLHHEGEGDDGVF
ncbi:ferritin-1, chloroplastic-like [Coffea eugenioides]|uniref:ferritin-1, chloroplastic-like n=1 Tax=Coffea eugenioides TaxID=49369 RepID=UPI000F614464|nr:ferritin-1, chloroplastic-like [Coffea eugenioides]